MTWADLLSACLFNPIAYHEPYLLEPHPNLYLHTKRISELERLSGFFYHLKDIWKSLIKDNISVSLMTTTSSFGLLTFSLMIDQNGFVFSGPFLFARQFIHFSKIGSTQSMLNGGCGFDDEFYVNFLSLKQPMLSLLPLFPAALVSMRSWFHRFEHLRQISMRWV